MPNRFQIKRTTTTGLLPNVSNSSNTSYIAAGELAINLTDRKLLSSNGSATFEIGANLASMVVGTAFTLTSGNANFDSGVLFVDGTNNRVGVNNTTPGHALSITGTLAAGNTTITGFANVSSTLAAGNTTITGFANVSTTATIGTGFTLTSGNANFDSGALFVDGTNNRVGVGTTAPTYTLEVNGSFAATTKSFVINHPTKPDMKLRYGSLEGPENGVYVRGCAKGDTIQLPDYWTGLVDECSITVNLTPIGSHQKLYVKSIDKNVVTVGGGLFDQMEYFYTVFAERKDVDKLIVEI
jgi:hypothetical protein